MSALGLVATAGGTEHSSIGLFRSPDDPQRPVSVVLTAGQIASDHDDPGAVMTGLREVCASDPNTNSHILQLPVGSALAAVREEPAMIEIEGAGPLPLPQRQILAWIPDPTGSAVAMIGFTSNGHSA